MLTDAYPSHCKICDKRKCGCILNGKAYMGVTDPEDIKTAIKEAMKEVLNKREIGAK